MGFDLEQFAYPFGVGMLAAFNPCGFTMLPTYLGYFIGTESTEQTTHVRTVLRGLWVGLVLTAGFIAVFGGLGILIAQFLNQGTVLEHLGWVTTGFGIVLIPMGVAMYMGRQVMLRLPKMSKGTDSRESGSMFLFGVSYAIVSLSCTIGLFLQAVSNTFTNDGFWTGVGSFIAYAVGMGSVILYMTVSLARAKSNMVTRMRRMMPHMHRISGAILVVAGLYLIDYGVWELRVLDDPTVGNVVVDQVLEFQGAVSNWIIATTPERLGVLAVMGIAWLLLLAWRDDNPDDATRRWSLTAVWFVVLGYLEASNDFDFLIAPTLRFVANWPARVGHWFTDPQRAGVPLEILFVGLVGFWAYRRLSRLPSSRQAEPAATG